MKNKKMFSILILAIIVFLSSAALAFAKQEKKHKSVHKSGKKAASRSIASVGNQNDFNNDNNSNNRTPAVVASKQEQEQIQLGEVNTIYDKETPCHLKRGLDLKSEFSEYEKTSEQGGSNSRGI